MTTTEIMVTTEKMKKTTTTFASSKKATRRLSRISYGDETAFCRWSNGEEGGTASLLASDFKDRSDL